MNASERVVRLKEMKIMTNLPVSSGRIAGHKKMDRWIGWPQKKEKELLLTRDYRTRINLAAGSQQQHNAPMIIILSQRLYAGNPISSNVLASPSRRYKLYVY